ncbi:T9SS type A sorting domain-containing protein [Tamlana crocina]
MKNLYVFLLTLSMTSFCFGQELLTNGNFENWDDPNTPSGWDKYESVAQETSTIHAGSNALKVIATSTRDLTQSVSIQPGETYQISLWYYVETGDGSDARIWSYWLNGTSTVADASTDDALRGPNNDYFTSSPTWQQYTATVTAPSSGVDGFRFEVRSYNNATVYWDDLSFVDTNTLSNKTTEITNFNIFPNPTSLGHVNISSNSTEKMDVTIYNLIGKQVLKPSVINNKIDISSLQAGVYLIKAFQNGKLSTKKLVVK